MLCSSCARFTTPQVSRKAWGVALGALGCLGHGAAPAGHYGKPAQSPPGGSKLLSIQRYLGILTSLAKRAEAPSWIPARHLLGRIADRHGMMSSIFDRASVVIFTMSAFSPPPSWAPAGANMPNQVSLEALEARLISVGTSDALSPAPGRSDGQRARSLPRVRSTGGERHVDLPPNGSVSAARSPCGARAALRVAHALNLRADRVLAHVCPLEPWNLPGWALAPIPTGPVAGSSAAGSDEHVSTRAAAAWNQVASLEVAEASYPDAGGDGCDCTAPMSRGMWPSAFASSPASGNAELVLPCGVLDAAVVPPPGKAR